MSARDPFLKRCVALSAWICVCTPALAETGWGDLANWVGRYPNDKLGPAGAELLAIPAIKGALREALPAAELQSLGHDFALADQVFRVGHYILADYCTPHDCGASNVTVVLDQTSDNLWVAFFHHMGRSVSTRWYGTADSAELPMDVQKAVIAVHRPAP